MLLESGVCCLFFSGAVRIWKPQVTPLSELRPAELKTIKTATGDEMQTVQKTSLVMNKPSQVKTSLYTVPICASLEIKNFSVPDTMSC